MRGGYRGVFYSRAQERGPAGISRISFGSDVHGVLFLHKNVLLRENGFVQGPASPETDSDPHAPFMLEATL